MNACGRGGKNRTTTQAGEGRFRLAPVAHAIALALAASGAVLDARAQQAFSGAWFSAKGATQNTAAATGRLPNGAPAAPLTSPLGQQQQASQQLQRSIDNLGLVARAIAAQQAAQAAARQAGLKDAPVPEGLADGGLKVDTGSLTAGWLNAKAPQQTVADGRTTVSIEQTKDKAILNWESFNVGKDTTLVFQQQRDWAVLNRVNDPLARPSQIQGQIKGDGTVLIVNRNGVVFSGGSQVDTRNLVAAAAGIADSQFLARGIYGADAIVPTFTDALGKIDVRAGARIATRAPTSETQGGGYVLLLGSEVSNAGEIASAKGQTLLAAGDHFIIRKGVGSDGNAASTTRGNEVAPRFNADSLAGKVVNSGLIVAREGDVTLAGRALRQDGVALATTSVNTRGTLHLLNSAADAQGKVALGKGATTAVVLEDDGKSTALDSQRDALLKSSAELDKLRDTTPAGAFDNLSLLADRRDQSRVEIVSGGDIVFEGGALTLATGGQIAASAGRRSFVADGAQMDVSGAVGVKLAMDSNNIKVNVQGNEQRDAAENRDSGKLINANVWIDRRKLTYVPAGTGGYAGERWYTAGGLLEVGGYLGNQGHGIGEWSAQGGTITLGGKEVVTQAGSTINLSGGSLDVQTGYLNQTWLKGADGRLYNANQAPADTLFTGVYRGSEVEHARWGKDATEYHNNPLVGRQRQLENGYTAGRDAGTLIVSAPTAVLEGDIVARVFNGAQQGGARAATADAYKQSQTAVAQAGTLALGRYSALGRVGLFDTEVRFGDVGQTTRQMAAADALGAERIGTLWLDSSLLSGQRLGAVDVATAGTVTLSGAVTLADGGRFEATAAVVDFGADVTAHGGKVNASNIFQSAIKELAPRALSKDGVAAIVLRDGATLDLSGLRSNLAVQPDQASRLAYLDGGAVRFESTRGVATQRGSLIDVSSGAALLANGKQRGGRGGSVALLADSAATAGNDKGELALDGAIRAHGVLGGGTLALASGTAIHIGAGPTAPDALRLDAARLQSGFSRYDINGHAGVTVLPGAQVDVAVPVLRHVPGSAEVALELWTPPQFQFDGVKRQVLQRQGADLVLRSQRRPTEGGNIVIGAGASVSVDAGRSISLLGGGMSSIVVDGALNAWGGNIAIDIDGPPANSPVNLSQKAHTRSVWISGGGVLDVAARAQTATDERGRRYGTVRQGGNIAIGGAHDWEGKGEAAASDIAIVVRPGALLDASGAGATVDLAAGDAWRPVQLASDGGEIVLKSAHSLYLDGALRARAGGAGAAGGTLAVALAAPVFSVSYQPDDAVRAQRELRVSQTHQMSGLSAGLLPGQADAALVYGAGRLSAERIGQGGFGNLSLLVDGTLSFEGDVRLATQQSMRLYAGSYALADGAPADAQVHLASSHLRLAAATRQAKDSEVLFGVGWRNGASERASEARFTATADLVEVRDRVGFGAHGQIGMKDGTAQTIDRRGFDAVDIVSRGDLRLLGGSTGRGLSGATTTELATLGDMSISAAQIYPASGVDAQIVAGYGDGRTLDIRRYGDTQAAAPLSVFGSLTLGAATVRQGGVLRAPLGRLLLGRDSRGASTAHAGLVELRAGSLTSVSGAGVLMPYGGTVDGIAYDYAGKPVAARPLGGAGITLAGDSVVGHDGAVLDLSGGGELTGAAFVSGRGGSVDILRTPLANANPAFGVSKASNAVYAIVPGLGAAYAPVAADAGAGAPMVGRQLTLKQDVAGLKAGTYTLMPSNYALLPGAFRVEVGAAGGQDGVVNAAGPSFVAPGYLGVANTDILAALPNQVIVTPAAAVRKYATYNETSYAGFVAADAARRGGLRGALPADAGSLRLDYDAVRTVAGQSMLQFGGKALFKPAAGGFGGTLEVKATDVEVLANGTAPTPAFFGASLRAADLNAFGAERMLVGGSLDMAPGDNFATFKASARNVTLRGGAQLRAAEVFLLTSAPWGGIVVEQGASINTTGMGKPSYDAANGLVYSAGVASVLGVSNGVINLLPPTSSGGMAPGSIDIGKCAAAPCTGDTTLYGEGTLAIATDKSFTLAENARYGAKNLLLSVSALNLGSNAALDRAAAAGQLPVGLSLNQGVLDRLLSGNAGAGVPAVESLILNARESVNIYGAVALNTLNPAGAKSAVGRLVLGTPAIYGYGAAGDKASITTDEFIWTGSAPQSTGYTGYYLPNHPGAAIGALLGDSTLDISARRILFGYGPQTQPGTGLPAQRLALGFGAVRLNASEQLSANGKGTLEVYHRQGAYLAGQGYQYTGGDLFITAPLLTGEAASVNRITAGGALDVRAPAGAAAAAAVDALGAELQLAGRSVRVDSAVALPSGKLTLSATDALTLGEHARIDLAGRAVKFFEQTRHSWGGDLVLNSRDGDIVQHAGSSIDLSAGKHRGGTLSAVALGAGAGRIDLAGSILGGGGGEHDAGGTMVPYDAAEISLRAQTLADFAGLNARLNTGKVFGARRFQIKQGDLLIGDELKARRVDVAVDGGKLTVNGRIDASGVQVGSIRLAARGDLLLNGALDAHGSGLRVDSYGKIIDSPNRATVELTTREGTLALGSGASVDLRAGTATPKGNDGAARGTLSLNAPRLGGAGDGSGEHANDVALSVAGRPAIAGAASVAVNAFRSYDDAPLASLPDVSGKRPQLITQTYLDDIDADNGLYIDAALANADLGRRLAGLGAYHLRPGVEIVSAAGNPGGNLTVAGDLDLSGYRYGPGANRADPARRGYGEPGVLVIRAGGDLSVHGSINDGFAPPPATPDDRGWYLSETRRFGGDALTPYGGDIVVGVDGVALEAGTLFPRDAVLNYDLPAAALTLPAGTVVPVEATLTDAHTLRAGTVLAAPVYRVDGSVALAAGAVLAADVTLDVGMKLGAGTVLRGDAAVAALVWPKGVKLPMAMAAGASIALPRGALIPSMTKVELLNDEPVKLRPESAGKQGQNWALAPMLGEGSTSWDLQLNAGADLGSADRRAVNPLSSASLLLGDTHSMTRVVTKLGGTGFVFGPNNQGFPVGTPVGQKWLDDGNCDSVPGSCVIDPSRIAMSWGPEAPGWSSDFVVGQPVPEWALFYCELSPETCVAVVKPARDVTTYTLLSPMFSVLRTGTGDLDMTAAGDLRMQSPFGIYTAGTRAAAILDAGGVNRYNQPRGQTDGSPIGKQSADYGAALAGYQAWYPEHGGNVGIAVGRDVIGDVWAGFSPPERSQTPSAGVGNWLWRQGTGSTAGGAAAIPAAWWINFGAYAPAQPGDASSEPYIVGFTGVGTLGGGNLTIAAGGNAGATARRGDINAADYPRSQALVAAVGGSGRVADDGTLTLTGGGDLRIRAGGAVNPALDALQNATSIVDNRQRLDLNGALINLRGMTTLAAGAIGAVKLRYRELLDQRPGYDGDAGDVRPIDPFTPTIGVSSGGINVVPGDSAFYLDTMGDLVLATAADAGRVYTPNKSAFTTRGVQYKNGGQSWFSLWTERTAINLFSAGGNLTPNTDIADGKVSLGNTDKGDTVIVYPSILRATAASGSVYFGYSAGPGSSTAPTERSLLLAPSSRGALEFLAGTSLFGGGLPVSMSGADTPLPTPFRPAFAGFTPGGNFVASSSNLSPNGSLTDGGFTSETVLGYLDRYPLFAFGPDTQGATALHAGDPSAALFYAVKGDILGLSSGMVHLASSTQQFPWYRAATAARVQAGRDIVGGSSLFVHNNANDVSLVQAGRDILYANIKVAGPGTLEMAAGRNLLQENRASVVSIGALVQGDSRPGADIAMTAGAGAKGPDYSALAKRYLDPANVADAAAPLAGQAGKVAKSYAPELGAWLKHRFAFQGTAAESLAYFNGLAPEQQRIFLRSVYFAELREGGREYNNVDSKRYGSFLRGREMIATLFPDRDADGKLIARSGDIVMYGGSGVHTDFGGDIQMLAPGGQIVVGVQGEAPGGSAGVMTQGQGHIQLFSEGSLLLGLSRIMTTFGGDIFAWSEQGDINAGRGAKTTLVYTPPKRVYDNLGNVTLSPQVPSSGAGIATLAPIPEVPGGDIDLIAPLGTIDAGEAGIRVSGNVNIGAPQVLNAENILVKGAAAGIPTVAAVNVGALSNASAAASQATAAAQDVGQRERAAARKALPSIFTVRVTGFGGEAEEGGEAAKAPAGRPELQSGVAPRYEAAHPVQLLGLGGSYDAKQLALLTDEERRSLQER
ncbi:filamentous haemagglutinin family protein [Janthinobacterium fluminis]|uniref:Filamentous hemagglutinin family protein n=1 Tax=Janthinobacterium fluminis TaxID=2987524 RepID=A0ABT5K3V3_9BURK|nr:filamentous haemagglutinin family protein [Janthinobacterium fluminis]MDC8759663.1 filamentous hemagglutinin family protein [Janthinobacterium fluminis]